MELWELVRGFPAMLLLEPESFLTDEIRAEQAAACTKEREATDEAGDGAAA